MYHVITVSSNRLLQTVAIQKPNNFVVWIKKNFGKHPSWMLSVLMCFISKVAEIENIINLLDSLRFYEPGRALCLSNRNAVVVCSKCKH